jgi:hypothetical protein
LHRLFFLAQASDLINKDHRIQAALGDIKALCEKHRFDLAAETCVKELMEDWAHEGRSLALGLVLEAAKDSTDILQYLFALIKNEVDLNSDESLEFGLFSSLFGRCCDFSGSC